MNEPVKLVALDLDRTTLNSQGHLSVSNRQAIISAINKGIHVCIASGRAFDTLPEDILSVPGIEYAITSNGAAVYRISGKECLKSYILTEQSVKTILKLTADDPVTYEAFIRGQAFGSTDYVNNPDKYGATEHSLSYVKKTRVLMEDIAGFILEHCNELDSIDIIVRDEFHKKKLHEMITAEEKRVYVTSSVKQLLEISDCHAGKHSGLSYVLDCLGLQPEQSAAFGDADNDIDMIRFAGASIAMENASESLKAQADFITKANDEDGVVCALKDILHLL